MSFRLTLFAALLQGALVGQLWTPAITRARPGTYFRYANNRAEEIPAASVQPVYQTPAETTGCDPAAKCLASCIYEDRFPWFVDANGGDLTGAHPLRNPGAGSVSSKLGSVQGLKFAGSLDGTAKGAPVDYVWEVVFFHQEKCYAGGSEYGFRRDAVSGAFQFYWSINSKC